MFSYCFGSFAVSTYLTNFYSSFVVFVVLCCCSLLSLFCNWEASLVQVHEWQLPSATWDLLCKCFILIAFSKHPCLLFFFLYWTEYLFILYYILYCLRGFSYGPSHVYRYCPWKRAEMRCNYGNIYRLVSFTCYSSPWPFKSLLFCWAVCVVLVLVFRFVCYMKIYLDLTSFLVVPRLVSPVVRTTNIIIPFLFSELSDSIPCCLMCLGILS